MQEAEPLPHGSLLEPFRQASAPTTSIYRGHRQEQWDNRQGEGRLAISTPNPRLSPFSRSQATSGSVGHTSPKKTPEELIKMNAKAHALPQMDEIIFSGREVRAPVFFKGL